MLAAHTAHLSNVCGLPSNELRLKVRELMGAELGPALALHLEYAALCTAFESGRMGDWDLEIVRQLRSLPALGVVPPSGVRRANPADELLKVITELLSDRLRISVKPCPKCGNKCFLPSSSAASMRARPCGSSVQSATTVRN